MTQLRFHPAILTDPVTGVTKGPYSRTQRTPFKFETQI